MMQTRLILSFLLALIAAGQVTAETVGDTTLGGGLSVFGPMVETTYRVEADGRLRSVFIGGLGFDENEQDDNGNAYDVDIAVAAGAVLYDFYPHQTGWRVSGGLFLNFSDIEVVGTGASTEPFEIDGEVFDGGRVDAKASFANDLAPMITTGYDHDFGNDWVLSGEIGAIFIGGIETEFTANSDRLQQLIDEDDEFQDVREDANDIDILPYVSVSVSFQF